MGSATKFAALNTKIQALSGRLLTDKDYNSLLDALTVNELLGYLKEHSQYKGLFTDIGVGELSIEKLEVRLKKYLIEVHEKLIYYTKGVYKDIFKLFFVRSEIEDLKIYLRYFVRGQDLSKLESLVVTKGKRSNLDYESLNQATSIEDFVEKLKGTRYYRILKLYVKEEPKKILFYMEMNLDRIYFKSLMELVLTLPDEEKKPVMKSLGHNIDFLNFQWIYRGLKFYKVSPEELLNYTLGQGFYLKYELLKDYCYTEDAEELLDKMRQSKYGLLLENTVGIERFLEIEMERYVFRDVKEGDKNSKFNILKAIYFIHRVEYEMRDIFTIIEAKRYHLEREEIKKYLIKEIL